MSVAYEIEVSTQESVYRGRSTGENGGRNLKVYFSVPEKGVDSDTGLLLFIAGFGGNANSNVYKKMRSEFADEYNLVTIQCDYFGYEFMQESRKIVVPKINKEKLRQVFNEVQLKRIFKKDKLDFEGLLDIGENTGMNITVNEDLSKENKDNFNDMGIMQAIDNITAVLSVMNILYNNEYSFNSKKIITFGQSHGAYLGYLCNAFAPDLFSLIVDNSAWLLPVYLGTNRILMNRRKKLNLNIVFDYLAKGIVEDREILNLSYLYSKFENNCRIISYHGTKDNLVASHEKKRFCEGIDNCVYNEISNDKIDNTIFKSANHGLDADFIELFRHTLSNFNVEFKKDNNFCLREQVVFKTKKHNYNIDYKNVMPQIRIE